MGKSFLVNHDHLTFGAVYHANSLVELGIKGRTHPRGWFGTQALEGPAKIFGYSLHAAQNAGWVGFGKAQRPLEVVEGIEQGTHHPQLAVAAGILGGGSRFLGVTEDAAGFLAGALAGRDALPTDDAGWDALALEVITATRAAGRFVPGLGHPVHKVGDPRTPVFMDLARRHDAFGPHLSLFAAIGRAHPEVLGRTLPLNGAGVCGAVLADLGFSPAIVRGFALLARCAGVLGHIAEEQVDPIGYDIYMSVDRNIDYAPPA